MRTTDPRRVVGRGANYLVLIALSLVALTPILWMISASLKTSGEILRYPPTILPEDIRWENYVEVFTLQPFAQQFLNSVVIMALVAALTLVMSIPARSEARRVGKGWRPWT